MDFIRQLWQFMRARKKLWFMPVLLVLLLLGALIVLAQTTAVAPFIYSLF